MTTIDWHQEPSSDEERALRAEVINVATEDGLAKFGIGGWSWVSVNLTKLCSGGEASVASDLRSAIRDANERAAAEREASRVRDAEAFIARARERLQTR